MTTKRFKEVRAMCEVEGAVIEKMEQGKKGHIHVFLRDIAGNIRKMSFAGTPSDNYRGYVNERSRLRRFLRTGEIS